MSGRSGSEKRLRGHLVGFRATLDEKRAVEAAAASSGLSVAEFCRRAVANAGAVGNCGQSAPVFVDWALRPGPCVLPAGHKGWHQDEPADGIPPARWGVAADMQEQP